MSSDNKKFYFSVIENEEATSFFHRSVEDKLNMEIWQKGQKKDEVEEFEILSYDEESNSFELKFKGGLLSKLTGSKNKDKDVLVKIQYHSIYLFSNTKLEFDAEKECYVVSLKQDIYKSQQRSNYRLMASRYIKIQFKIDEEVFDALDISAGGTSFTIPEEMESKFEKDAVYNNCVVRVANQNFDIPKARIAGMWDHEYMDSNKNVLKGFKVGVAFIELPKQTEEDLFLVINTEARGVELRKKGLLK